MVDLEITLGFSRPLSGTPQNTCFLSLKKWNIKLIMLILYVKLHVKYYQSSINFLKMYMKFLTCGHVLICYHSWWWFSHLVVPNSCNPMDCSFPGSSVHEIVQARILKWIVISFPIHNSSYYCKRFDTEITKFPC